MQPVRTVQLLIAGLFVFAFITGCTSQAQPAVQVVKAAATRAKQAAAVANNAQQRARTAKNPGDFEQFLRQADDASRQAALAADEARVAQQSIDDSQLRFRVEADVKDARESADDARRVFSIFDTLPRPRSSVDNIADDIVIRANIRVEEGPGQLKIKAIVKDVVKASFCDALVETLNKGQFPS